MKRHFIGAALATLCLLPVLAASSVRAQQALTPAQIAPDLAITEMIARRPLSAQERAQVMAIDQAQFRRDPAWCVKALNEEAAETRGVRRLDPVRLADWRKARLTGAYFYVGPRVTPEETKALVAIYTRADPIVDADPATKTIVTERDVDAWVAATRLVSAEAGVRVPDPRVPVLAVAHQRDLSGALRSKAANMERNWAAFQLCWRHEPAADRRVLMARITRLVRQDMARGTARGAAMAAGASLALTANVCADYPAALSPKFAAMKARLRANDVMAGSLMTLGWMNSAIGHTLTGQGFPGPLDP